MVPGVQSGVEKQAHMMGPTALSGAYELPFPRSSSHQYDAESRVTSTRRSLAPLDPDVIEKQKRMIALGYNKE